MHRQCKKLSTDFILKAARTCFLTLIEREFPGIDFAHSLILISLLRGGAFFMTAEHLSCLAIDWAKPGCYDCTFADIMCCLANSFVEPAHSLPTSPDFDLSTFFPGLSIGLTMHDMTAFWDLISLMQKYWTCTLPMHNTIHWFLL